uniref:Uncharacterized protein n=1 Tax=Rhodosorus marinus TaxID=101924 RepID=A0A7S0BGH7_9RHOD|mmetsp:Transcript_12850/g.18497  ORF Transcript_12850/g.18497 Transcript_12850/m.18497 type:complete len:144 (+) Transcript_12850:119-550(+)
MGTGDVLTPGFWLGSVGSWKQKTVPKITSAHENQVDGIHRTSFKGFGFQVWWNCLERFYNTVGGSIDSMPENCEPEYLSLTECRLQAGLTYFRHCISSSRAGFCISLRTKFETLSSSSFQPGIFKPLRATYTQAAAIVEGKYL